VKVTAAVVETKCGPFELRELELDDLRPDEVLVEVAASGICHTDLICRDQWLPVPLPAVLGHEGAGVVREVGSAVTHVAPGDRVAMTFDSCGECPACARARAVYCHRFFDYNFAAARQDGSSALDGVHAHFFGQSSFATHSIARERNVVKIEDSIPLDLVAPMVCGIQTGAGSVLNVMRPPAGSNIAVFGVGAVGLAAVIAARISGCAKIVAVDLHEHRLRLAQDLGATHAVNGNDGDLAEQVRRAVPGGVDYSLEATGSPQVVRAAIDCLAPLGECGIVGAPALGTEASFDVTELFTAGRVIRGIVVGESIPSQFLPRLIELWRRGQFPVDRMMSYYDFDQIDEAARAAESGAVVKPVLRMG
jgi:aryl-alcohol dehydrogenase